MATFIIHGSIAAIVATLCGQSLPRVLAYALLVGLVSKSIDRVLVVTNMLRMVGLSSEEMMAKLTRDYPSMPASVHTAAVQAYQPTFKAIAEGGVLFRVFLFAPTVLAFGAALGLAFYLFA